MQHAIRQQAHQRQCGHGLAATRFAEQRKSFALPIVNDMLSTMGTPERSDVVSDLDGKDFTQEFHLLSRLTKSLSRKLLFPNQDITMPSNRFAADSVPGPLKQPDYNACPDYMVAVTDDAE